MAFPIVIEIAFVTLGDAMKEKRRQLNLSQSELAGILGFNQTSIQQWETRKRFPRPAQFMRVAEWLGIHKGLLRL